MAEGINRMTPEELMLVDGYEAIVEMLGIETPIGIAAKIAAFRNGKPMTPNEKRELSEQSIQLVQQAKDMGYMPTTQLSGMQESLPSPMPGDMALTDAEINQMLRNEPGAAISDAERRAIMTDEELMSYQVDDGEMQMTPSQMTGMQQSGAITPDTGTVMSLEEAIAAGIVMPTRPQARPMMTSPRPQMRR